MQIGSQTQEIQHNERTPNAAHTTCKKWHTFLNNSVTDIIVKDHSFKTQASTYLLSMSKPKFVPVANMKNTTPQTFV